ncbi:MAG TPA: alkaline phosphatase family protein [Bacteroidia bacterium]|nr:alkaline phosphatase family protein [Bacteroidia bacterium]
MHRILISFVFTLFVFSCNSQQKKTPINYEARPRLIIGIVVDQMRYDYIDHYWDKFSSGGFKRLVNEGTLFKNCHYNYVPTETAPGHASIYTGATPSVHGIIGNVWWNYGAKKSLSSVQDENNPSQLSPNKLLVETLTDRFKKSFAGSRVYSISIKDRGAILPGGKNADAAFWFNDTTGKWISSRYYNEAKTNAKWVADFNNADYPKQFLKKGWNLIPGHHYDYPDSSSSYEGTLGNNNQYFFPYRFDSTNYGSIKYTSWGNKLTALFAEQALMNEKLGQTKVPDFLCISFSSTDYVGHKFGINSVEIEQTYLDLDGDIANLLNLFDKQIGKNNYLVFLSADHGAVSNPQYLLDNGQTGGVILFDTLNLKLKNLAGDVPRQESLILDFSGDQVKFNEPLIKARNLDMDSLLNVFTDFLATQPGIALALTSNELKTNKYKYGIRQMIQNGFHASRNAEIVFVLKPNWLTWYNKKGTSHGTPYEYDTHVPLIFYGWKIKNEKSDTDVKITDIAPTVSKLLGIELSNSTGTPIKELFGN